MRFKKLESNDRWGALDIENDAIEYVRNKPLKYTSELFYIANILTLDSHKYNKTKTLSED